MADVFRRRADVQLRRGTARSDTNTNNVAVGINHWGSCSQNTGGDLDHGTIDAGLFLVVSKVFGDNAAFDPAGRAQRIDGVTDFGRLLFATEIER